ncbi:MAG: hypothetical protein ACI8XB_000467 [Patiriisocius sp.]|jgi:hypothetical protein
MLDYSKTLLNKVSFDRRLFKKELNKAISWIKKEDRLTLQIWCLATYGHMYKDVIVESFNAMI